LVGDYGESRRYHRDRRRPVRGAGLSQHVERRHRAGEHWQEINDKRARFGALLLNAIRSGPRKGTLRDDLDPTIVMLAMFGMVSWAVCWLKANGRLSVPEIAGILGAVLFDGLRAPVLPAPVPRRRARPEAGLSHSKLWQAGQGRSGIVTANAARLSDLRA
jgi:hypothetical protein